MVRKKGFLISTFLVPLSFAAIMGVQVLAMTWVEAENYTILVQKEDTPLIIPNLKSDQEITFKVVDEDLESLREQVDKSSNQAVLILPQKLAIDKVTSSLAITIYSKKSLSDAVVRDVRKRVYESVRSYKIEQAGLTRKQLAQLDFELDAQTHKWTDKGTKSTDTTFAMLIGYAVSFMMYILVSIYGSLLMQSVIEEKSNRIVEVIVSSLRPFELLMGKTLANAMVGMTQFLLWVILMGIAYTVLGFVIIGNIDPEAIVQPGVSVDMAESEAMAERILVAVQNFEWKVLWFFPFYFLGGFFLYGSLLAAAGSAVDNIQDAQQFVLPVTIPMLLPLLFIFNVIQNPNGSFAVFASIFPFFSSVSMMVRMSLTEVPWYEVLASVLALIATFVGGIWLAGRIYRTGILMYGKKPTFREIFRWIRYN